MLRTGFITPTLRPYVHLSHQLHFTVFHHQFCTACHTFLVIIYAFTFAPSQQFHTLSVIFTFGCIHSHSFTHHHFHFSFLSISFTAFSLSISHTSHVLIIAFFSHTPTSFTSHHHLSHFHHTVHTHHTAPHTRITSHHCCHHHHCTITPITHVHTCWGPRFTHIHHNTFTHPFWLQSQHSFSHPLAQAHSHFVYVIPPGPRPPQILPRCHSIPTSLYR